MCRSVFIAAVLCILAFNVAFACTLFHGHNRTGVAESNPRNAADCDKDPDCAMMLEFSQRLETLKNKEDIDQAYRNFYTKKYEREIINNLGLAHAPIGGKRHPRPPQDVIDELVLLNTPTEEEKLSEAIILLHTAPKCEMDSICLFLNFTNYMSHKKINKMAAVELHLYIVHNGNVFRSHQDIGEVILGHERLLGLREVVRNDANHIISSRRISHSKTNIAKGWVKFPIKNHVLSRWLASGKELVEMEVYSTHETLHVNLDDDHQMFLRTFIKEDDASRRHRRSVNRGGACTDDQQTCCMQSFDLQFSSISSLSFVHQPQIATLNFCKGVCYNDNFNRSHTYIMSHIPENQRRGHRFCCLPTSYELIRLIYEDQHPTPKIYLRDMAIKVGSCGCV